MTDYTELKSLAEAMKGWELTQCWPAEESESDWEVGGLTDGERYPVLTIDTDQYDAAYLAPTIARYYSAANPAAILALIAENERLTKQWGDRPAYRTPEYESKRDAMWRRAHMVATSKGYDHINMAIAAAPCACADCMGCGGEWQGEGAPNSACETCKGSRGKALEEERDQLKAENEALNSAINHLERSRVTSFEEYDFSRLKGRAGAQKVFEITIETECGCDIKEGEYTVRVTHLLGNWLGDDDFSLIEEAVAEVIADLNLPEEGHTTFIAFESGERQDVFWTKWFEIVNVASVLAEPDAAMSKGEQP